MWPWILLFKLWALAFSSVKWEPKHPPCKMVIKIRPSKCLVFACLSSLLLFHMFFLFQPLWPSQVFQSAFPSLTAGLLCMLFSLWGMFCPHSITLHHLVNSYSSFLLSVQASLPLLKLLLRSSFFAVFMEPYSLQSICHRPSYFLITVLLVNVGLPQ